MLLKVHNASLDLTRFWFQLASPLRQQRASAARWRHQRSRRGASVDARRRRWRRTRGGRARVDENDDNATQKQRHFRQLLFIQWLHMQLSKQVVIPVHTCSINAQRPRLRFSNFNTTKMPNEIVIYLYIFFFIFYILCEQTRSVGTLEVLELSCVVTVLDIL